MFLNLVDGGERRVVSCVVDENPGKQGCFVPGTGHPITSPRDLPGIAPQRVLIMNPVYRGEIGHRLEELGCSALLVEATAEAGPSGSDASR